MGRRITHSEERWKIMEAEGSMIVRCVAPTQAGTQCKREALAGSVVCDKHGGHLPNVQKRGKERMVHLVDKATARVEAILDNPKSSDAAVLKAAEIVGRAAGIEDAKKVVVEVDGVEQFFNDLLSTPGALVDAPSRPAAIPERQIVQGEVIEPPQDETPPLPPPENVTPLNGWADVDQPARKRSIFDTPADAEEARRAARIPKNVRDRLG